MKCPVCKNVYLRGIKLDGDLPAYSCERCDGVQLPLLYYRDWAARKKEVSSEPKAVVETEDSPSSLHCSKCYKFMEKVAIKGDVSNKLDFCAHCDEVWLDKGEWELLDSLALSDKLASIITAPWQYTVKKDISENKTNMRFSKLIGEPDFEKAKAFREWLKDHPKRADIVFYLSQL